MGDGVALVDVSEGYVVEAVEEGGGYPVDAADADIAFGVAAGRGVGAAGGVADGCVAHDDDAVGAFAAGATFCGVCADGVGDGAEHCLVGGFYTECGGVEARREVGDGVDVYALGAVGEFDGAGGVFDGGAQVHAGGFEEGGAVAEAAEGVVVAGAEDDFHAGAHEAGERLVEQGGAFGSGDGAVVDVAADEEGVDTFGVHVVEQFVDELLVFAGEGAAVEGAAEVPVGGVQNLHAFSMALRHVLRLAVRHSRRKHSRGAGAPSSRRPSAAEGALPREHERKAAWCSLPASMSTKPPDNVPPPHPERAWDNRPMSFSSVEFTRAPEVSAEFAGRVRGLLRASALGDALGYPLELLSAEQIAVCDPKPWDSAFGELLISDDTQLTCFTLDGLTEVLEWNNEGAAADELACLWLAYLRWFRGIGESLPESAPFSLDREIDGAAELTARRGPGAATLRALGSGEMQLVSKSLNPDALGSGALVRSAALGVLPVAQERTVVLLAVRAAALTHGHPEALASAAAYALLVRDLLASPSGTFGALLEAARRVLSWCGSVAADDSIPGDASRTAAALSRAVELLEGGTVPVPEAVAEHFGTGWTAPELLGVALWCAADAVKSLPADADDATVRGALFEGLCRAVSVDSDSDSVGAMTAALWAAAGFPVGAEQESDAWSLALGRVRGLDQVEAVADRYLRQLSL